MDASMSDGFRHIFWHPIKQHLWLLDSVQSASNLHWSTVECGAQFNDCCLGKSGHSPPFTGSGAQRPLRENVTEVESWFFFLVREYYRDYREWKKHIEEGIKSCVNVLVDFEKGNFFHWSKTPIFDSLLTQNSYPPDHITVTLSSWATKLGGKRNLAISDGVWGKCVSKEIILS